MHRRHGRDCANFRVNMSPITDWQPEGLTYGLAGQGKPRLAVFEDDVHHPQQERIGQAPAIFHEDRQHPFTDPETFSQRFIAADDLGCRLQDFYARRAHRFVFLSSA
jgi:hypothetical protein